MTPGMRMPSVQELCQRHQVSLTTALQVLRHLESLGCVEARERVGYFVREPGDVALPRAREPELHEPLAHDPRVFAGINERISGFLEKPAAQARCRWTWAAPCPRRACLMQQRSTAWPTACCASNPTSWCTARPRPPPTPNSSRPWPGMRSPSACVAPADIGATLGNSEAVNLALDAIAEPGDVIAVESPTFFGILQAIEVRGLRALEIPCSPHTGMSLEALELAARNEPRLKGVVVVPHLQMPQGSVMPDAHKERLVALCVEHGLALIEDDIYREFVESPHVLRPAKAWDRQGDAGQVIYCASLSKSFAPACARAG